MPKLRYAGYGGIAGHGSQRGKESGLLHLLLSKGAFTFPGATMEQMIEVCVPHMLEANPGMTEAQARAMMEGFLPSLSRWR